MHHICAHDTFRRPGPRDHAFLAFTRQHFQLSTPRTDPDVDVLLRRQADVHPVAFTRSTPRTDLHVDVFLRRQADVHPVLKKLPRRLHLLQAIRGSKGPEERGLRRPFRLIPHAAYCLTRETQKGAQGRGMICWSFAFGTCTAEILEEIKFYIKGAGMARARRAVYRPPLRPVTRLDLSIFILRDKRGRVPDP